MKKIYLLIACLVFVHLFTQAQVRVNGPVNPSSPLDLYPTHIDSLGMGGFMVVANKVIRNNIPPLRRKMGMLVYVRETDSIYQLKSSSTDNILNDADWNKYKLSETGNSGFEWRVVFTDSVVITNGSVPVLSDGNPVIVDSKIKLPFSLPGTWDANRFDLPNTAPPYRRFMLGVSDSGTLALVEPISEIVKIYRQVNLNKKTIEARSYLDTIVGMSLQWTYQSLISDDLRELEDEVEIIAGPTVQIPQRLSVFDPGNPTHISYELTTFPNFIQVFSVRSLKLGVPKTASNFYFYVHLRLYNNSDTNYEFTSSDILEINALGWLRRFHFLK